MKGRLRAVIQIVSLFAVLLAGCAPANPSAPRTTTGDVARLAAISTATPLPVLVPPTRTPAPVSVPFVNLVACLRAAGADIEEGGRPSQPLFRNGSDVRVLRVGETQVEAYAFATEEQAIKSMSLVSSGGRVVADKEIEWDAPPRFYRWSSYLVVYVGESESVIETLSACLGQPKIGRVE